MYIFVDYLEKKRIKKSGKIVKFRYIYLIFSIILNIIPFSLSSSVPELKKKKKDGFSFLITENPFVKILSVWKLNEE